MVRVLRWHEGDALPPSLLRWATRVSRMREDELVRSGAPGGTGCSARSDGLGRTGRVTSSGEAGQGARPRRRQGPAIVVDGRSGSGKSTLADLLVRGLRVCGWAGTRGLHLDSWYPGWSGLEQGSRLTEELLTGARPTWPRWDWARNRPAGPSPELAAVPGSAPWVVEGAGALTPVSAGVCDLRIWVEADDEERHRRAMARDGEAYRPWWDMWARQEELHLARNRPRTLADVVVRT